MTVFALGACGRERQVVQAPTDTALVSALAMVPDSAPRSAPTNPSVARARGALTAAACVREAPPSTVAAGAAEQAASLRARGLEAARGGDMLAARELLRDAIRLDSTDGGALYHFARAQEYLAEYDDAAQAYCRLLSLAPAPEVGDDAAWRLARLVSLGAGTAEQVEERSVETSPAPPAQAAAARRPANGAANRATSGATARRTARPSTRESDGEATAATSARSRPEAGTTTGAQTGAQTGAAARASDGAGTSVAVAVPPREPSTRTPEPPPPAPTEQPARDTAVVVAADSATPWYPAPGSTRTSRSTRSGTVTGAVIGAAAGAAAGAAVKRNGKGAAVGAVLGGVLGAVIGRGK